ncbi:DUF350 domain-containing protein [Oerskovia sp. M15]
MSILDELRLDAFLSTIVYSVLGIVLLVVTIVVVNYLFKLNLHRELVDEHNTAFGIMIAGWLSPSASSSRGRFSPERGHGMTGTTTHTDPAGRHLGAGPHGSRKHLAGRPGRRDGRAAVGHSDTTGCRAVPGRAMDRPTVFAAALLVAVGGIIYELILGTAASYLFGDSVVAFSVATGLTLFGMGIGSLLATRLATNPGLNFVRNEVALALLGGSSVLILYAAFSLTEIYWLVFVLLSLAIGVGIGVEIPLLVALLKEQGRDESVGLLSKVLAVDYFGALAASLLFPFVMLPYLGLMRTAYAVALLNVLVAVFMLRRMGRRTRWTWFSWATVVLLVACFAASSAIEGAINTRLYQDPVVHYESTAYQKLVLTTFGDDVRLYLSDQLQFSSVDEARYHETLAHATLTSVAAPASVAILGAGTGCSRARCCATRASARSRSSTSTPRSRSSRGPTGS